MAELADAHGSGPCTRKGVEVRVLSSAPDLTKPFQNGRAFVLCGDSLGWLGQVEDQADADGLEQVASGLAGDASDPTDADLEEADVEGGQGVDVEAGQALVGEAVVDLHLAVGGVDAVRSTVAEVGAGDAEVGLGVGGEDTEAARGREGATDASGDGVEAATGAGGGGIGTLVGAGDGEPAIDAETDRAELAEVVEETAGATDGVDGAIGVVGEGEGGGVADGGVGEAAEVVGGDHAVGGELRVGEGSGGERGDGDQRGGDELHAVDSLAGRSAVWGDVGRVWCPPPPMDCAKSSECRG